MDGMARTRWRIVATAVAGLVLLPLEGCRSVMPLQPATRFGDRAAAAQELVLAQACTSLPGATPMGRPDGVRAHTLPAGRFRPQLEDEDGIYFASPAGILVTEPAPRGTRTLPGGVYLAHAQTRAWEYVGDAARISSRQPLPEHCAFRVEPRADAASPGN
jgi:hypothetical protein